MISQNQHHAANHFGLGCCRRDIEAMGKDPQGWLIEQLNPKHAETVAVPPSRESLVEYQEVLQERRQMQREAERDEAVVRDVEDMQRSLRRRIRRSVQEQTLERFEHVVTTRMPLRERLVHFYTNHFTVSQQGRPQITGSCVAYENEAIRARLDGHFADMLVNVVGHPVMLMYLDNVQSIGPNSRVGRRRNAGLNENLAREVLELHTLGVDGGYVQEDVTALAKILTGWTVGNPRRPRLGGKPGETTFVSFLHEPGTHRLLGRKYKDNGAKQGLEALRDLALHPATARHVATKLARHFTADTPPTPAIERLEKTYLATDGHLPSLHKELLHLEEAWYATRKFKTPHEYVASVFRGLDLPVGRAVRRGVTEGLRTMNQIPFTAPSPAGWADVASHWASPAALKQRVEWGVAVGQRLGADIDARAAAEWMLEPASSARLVKTLARAESAGQAMSLLLAAPDMQWRSQAV